MKIFNLSMAIVIASLCIGACNVDNADNPSNSVTTVDTTTTTPEPMMTDAVMVPIEADTTTDTGMQHAHPVE